MSEDHDSEHTAGVIKALIAGIAANLAVAIAKFVAFLATGSAAMMAESLHSAADSTNQGLLALGMKRAARPPTEEHPFGYAKESYFWAFVVAISIFLLGGAFAIYEGVHKMLHPEPITNPIWNYAALSVGFIVEAYALRVAWIEFQHFRRENPGPLFEALSATKDPTLPTVLFEDSAALVGLLAATLGVTLAILTGNAIWDGAASLVIGLVLVAVAWFLARESFSLLVGEAASKQLRDAVREVVSSDPAVLSLHELLTLQRGPRDVVVALVIEFDDGLRTDDIEKAVARLEAAIRDKTPRVRHIFIECGALHPHG